MKSIAAILAFCAVSALAQSQNIVQIAASTPYLSTLVKALQAGGLVSTLSGPGPFTVFAPTDTAFAALPNGALDFFLSPENKGDLVNVLTYHVASGAVYSNQLYNGEKIPTLDASQTVTVGINGNAVSINNAPVITANIKASNGVIHVIGGVLVPTNSGLPSQNLVSLLQADPNFSTLVTAVVAANLTAPLINSPALTVFAPTNAAFAKLPAATLDYLLKHPDQLAPILTYHVSVGRTYADELSNGELVPTLNGKDIYVGIKDGVVTLDGVANVTAVNTNALNGVVHTIDTVLIPKALF